MKKFNVENQKKKMEEVVAEVSEKFKTWLSKDYKDICFSYDVRDHLGLVPLGIQAKIAEAIQQDIGEDTYLVWAERDVIFIDLKNKKDTEPRPSKSISLIK